MAYVAMKKLIQNENNKYENAQVSKEEYLLWKTNTQNKLDVFFTCNRITQAQFEELSSMLLSFD